MLFEAVAHWAAPVRMFGAGSLPTVTISGPGVEPGVRRANVCQATPNSKKDKQSCAFAGRAILLETSQQEMLTGHTTNYRAVRRNPTVGVA